MNSKRSFLLGLFFLLTVFVVGYYSLFMPDVTMFKKQPRLVVHFSHTNGLREGDSVLVAGMRWGRVRSLAYDPKAPLEKRVTVTAALNEELALREGFSIVIEDQTVLGGHNLLIEPGPPEGALIAAGTELIGGVKSSSFEAIGALVKESQDAVEKIVGNIEQLAGDVRASKGPLGRLISGEQMPQDMADAVANAWKTLDSIQALSSNLFQGRGTIGQLLTNAELYQELRTAAVRLKGMLENASKVTERVSTGSGLGERLLNDQEWFAEVSRAEANIDSIIARAERGEGTLGLLLHDDKIAANVRTIGDRIATGEGTVGKLLEDQKLQDNLSSMRDDVATITATLRHRDGSLGHLLMDSELYDQIKTALLTVQRALEEYREAAPTKTFTKLFFKAF